MKVGGFNTLVSIMDRTSRQIINTEIENLKNQLDLTYVYKTLRLTTTEYTFLSVH